MNKFVISLIATLLISAFANAQSTWLVNNFESYLVSNNIDLYIDKATNIIDDLNGSEKASAENVLGLFKLLANINTNLSAEEFNSAANKVGLSFSTNKVSENLYILTYLAGSQISYVLHNANKEFGYLTFFTFSSKEGFSSATGSIKRGIGRNEFVNLTRNEKRYNFELVKVEKLEYR